MASMLKRHRFSYLALCIGVLALSGYVIRERLERALIAASIYRAHIMTPPPLEPGVSRLNRWEEGVRFYWDFAGIPVARAERLKEIDPTLKPLVREMSRREAAGENMQLPLHTYREIRWRLNFTPDLAATQARIASLRQSLADRAARTAADVDSQDVDGSWARGIDVWYLKLYYSVDEAESCQGQSNRPLTFLDRINSPDALTATLATDLHDDFTKTGVFNREETDETFSALARMLFATPPITCYRFNPGLKPALRKFVDEWQNPTTGYWGQ